MLKRHSCFDAHITPISKISIKRLLCMHIYCMENYVLTNFLVEKPHPLINYANLGIICLFSHVSLNQRTF